MRIKLISSRKNEVKTYFIEREFSSYEILKNFAISQNLKGYHHIRKVIWGKKKISYGLDVTMIICRV